MLYVNICQHTPFLVITKAFLIYTCTVGSEKHDSTDVFISKGRFLAPCQKKKKKTRTRKMN